uniref:Uncharacterized protein n=1 Tax=Arundo donax TaxID=35708 RepID=A0A0A9C8K9_ARUDO
MGPMRGRSRATPFSPSTPPPTRRTITPPPPAAASPCSGPLGVGLAGLASIWVAKGLEARAQGRGRQRQPRQGRAAPARRGQETIVLWQWSRRAGRRPREPDESYLVEFVLQSCRVHQA